MHKSRIYMFCHNTLIDTIKCLLLSYIGHIITYVHTRYVYIVIDQCIENETTGTNFLIFGSQFFVSPEKFTFQQIRDLCTDPSIYSLY